MIHYYKFRQDLFPPGPAREVYIKRTPGRGWPEQCPPIRAANSFGFDLLANFDLTFLQSRGSWRAQRDIIIDSDFAFASSEDTPGRPLTQQYAWFWEKGQKLPHVISDHVWKKIRNQVKVSSYLFLKTDPDELLLMTDPPNQNRPFKAMSAIVDTDWYPASYPWHIVLELDNREKRIRIRKGDPICRLIPIRRDTYFAAEMSQPQFNDFFTQGQSWLATHGRIHEGGIVDITKTYVRQQKKSRFKMK
jgi:hypothetical protein